MVQWLVDFSANEKDLLIPPPNLGWGWDLGRRLIWGRNSRKIGEAFFLDLLFCVWGFGEQQYLFSPPRFPTWLSHTMCVDRGWAKSPGSASATPIWPIVGSLWKWLWRKNWNTVRKTPGAEETCIRSKEAEEHRKETPDSSHSFGCKRERREGMGRFAKFSHCSLFHKV